MMRSRITRNSCWSVKSNGEICTGFSGKVSALTIYGFNPSGGAVDRARAVTIHATQPSFGAPK